MSNGGLSQNPLGGSAAGMAGQPRPQMTPAPGTATTGQHLTQRAPPPTGLVQGPGGQWGKYSPGGNFHENTNNRFGAPPVNAGPTVGNWGGGMREGGGYGNGVPYAYGPSGQRLPYEQAVARGDSPQQKPLIGQMQQPGANNDMGMLLSQLFGRRF